jgi:outer membrane lipoprotein-sorting protein
MSSPEPGPTDESADAIVVQRVRSAFELQPLPPRPDQTETMHWLAAQAKADLPPDPATSETKSIVPFVATMAVLAAVIVLLLSLRMDSKSAYAEVLDQMSKIETARFTITLQLPDKPEVTGRAVVRRPNLMRIDWKSGDLASVNLYKQDQLISFDQESPVTIHQLPSTGKFDIIKALRNVEEQFTRELPAARNKIPETRLLSIDSKALTGRLWIDTKSRLPVRIEMRHPPGKEPADQHAGVWIYSDFQWDPQLDASLFTIPADRKIVRDTLLSEPTEAELTAALAIRHAFSDAAYPADFFQGDCGLVVGRLAYDHDRSPQENRKRQRTRLAPIRATLALSEDELNDPQVLQRRIDYLCMKLDQWKSLVNRSGGWVGAGVLPGETEPLCWWKLKDQPIRVLYGDLTIREADQAPQPD